MGTKILIVPIAQSYVLAILVSLPFRKSLHIFIDEAIATIDIGSNFLALLIDDSRCARKL